MSSFVTTARASPASPPLLPHDPTKRALDIVSEAAVLAGAPWADARLARIETGWYPSQMLARNGVLYMATNGQGLRVVDVQKADRPRLMPRGETTGTYRAIAIAGEHLLAFADTEPQPWPRIRGARLEIFRLAEPLRPERIGELDLDLPDGTYRVGALSAAHVGLRAYAALANGAGGVLIFDLEDPARPRILGRVDLGFRVADVELRGRELWMAADHGLVAQVWLDALDAGAVLGQVRLPALGKGR
jgi:hypothetical protein